MSRTTEPDVDYTTAPYIAITPAGYGGYFGRGFTVAEAKANLKVSGGNLIRYVIYRLPAGATNSGINEMGALHWTWDATAPDRTATAEVIVSRGIKLGDPT